MRDDGAELDSAFERWLLDSARREALELGSSEQAWARFTKTSEHVNRSVSGTGTSWFGLAPARGHLISLAAGLVFGSALTAVVWPARDSARTPEASAPSLATRQMPASEPRASGVDAFVAPSAELPAAARETPKGAATPPAASAAARERITRYGTTSSPRRASPAVPRGSSLAAEIKALDAVKAAITSGDGDLALERVAAFHRAFPRAQLAADAEGLAIEALLAKGDVESAARRAARFLSDYPGDPHAARFAPIAEPR